MSRLITFDKDCIRVNSDVLCLSYFCDQIFEWHLHWKYYWLKFFKFRSWVESWNWDHHLQIIYVRSLFMFVRVKKLKKKIRRNVWIGKSSSKQKIDDIIFFSFAAWLIKLWMFLSSFFNLRWRLTCGIIVRLLTIPTDSTCDKRNNIFEVDFLRKIM